MSELKCPFCQQEIKIAGEHTTIMSCFNGDCKGSGLYGEKAFWQELIRTRKALNVAFDVLKIMNDGLPNGNRWKWKIEKAIDQIKQTTETKE